MGFSKWAIPKSPWLLYQAMVIHDLDDLGFPKDLRKPFAMFEDIPVVNLKKELQRT